MKAILAKFLIIFLDFPASKRVPIECSKCYFKFQIGSNFEWCQVHLKKKITKNYLETTFFSLLNEKKGSEQKKKTQQMDFNL